MAEIDVVILTEARYIKPDETDWYISQIIYEESLIISRLLEKGIKCRRIEWDNPQFDWEKCKLALFRTTWDYFEKLPKFLDWLNKTSEKIDFINSRETILWNLNKKYLSDLKNKGISIVPTFFFPKGESVSPQKLFSTVDSEEIVIKPVVSGTAKDTYRLNSNNISALMPTLVDLFREQEMMLQPFQESILNDGEISLIVIGGKCTHAIKKTPKSGDFRVQDDYGGTVSTYFPSDEERRFAEEAINNCGYSVLYGRVDVVRSNQGKLAIMELELIEPELFFRFHTPSARELADLIANRLEKIEKN
ncbi:Glutathione synthase/RimK-type ligase, ATP-grasp superfamily [Hyella patelloides LEGE 07179]|uniref:Glutathione synthase/RimK-type ligase, ATP-grasp superfamily n=1 Tax=Hyella patelloides LEGE 07179 TaxID=945734 RepID=A0A563W2T5_9CYAN|nr:hypothetical protein [Hyella patelloides]VEP17853.1 Glutathione synthase/RimK-type ligase, ATP-grasp superfamily [Hyella patelloides LEGE 07179]